MLWNVKVFRIIELTERSILNTIYNSRFKIDEECARDVVIIVSLVKENIFSVLTLRCEVFKHTITSDTMLHTKLTPELISNYNNKNVLMCDLRLTYFGYRIDRPAV